MGSSVERSKGPSVNKVWTPSKQKSMNLFILFRLIFQIFDINVNNKLPSLGTRGLRLQEYREVR